MADDFSVKIDRESARAMQRAIDKVAKTVGGKGLRDMLKDASKPVLRRAQSLAPVGPEKSSGEHLRFTLALRVGRIRPDGVGVRVVTGTRKKLGIAAATKPTLFSKGKNRGFYPMAVEVGTKRQRAQPYMRPAAKEEAPLVRARFGRALGSKLLQIKQPGGAT